ncbi:MAG: hypothetical protein KME55_16705 [Nostoc indistinguendum CM1-VF10]|nr:hypothetical protein [Nostoc indistinguendum CM1-VF10]
MTEDQVSGAAALAIASTCGENVGKYDFHNIHPKTLKVQSLLAVPNQVKLRFVHLFYAHSFCKVRSLIKYLDNIKIIT